MSTSTFSLSLRFINYQTLNKLLIASNQARQREKNPNRFGQCQNFIFFVLLLFIPIAPSDSLNGPLQRIRYSYQYRSSLILNNNDNLEPAGFKTVGNVVLENIWQDFNGYLAMIQLEEFRFQPRDSASKRFNADSPIINDWPPVLAHVDQNGNLRSLFVEKDNKNNKHHLIEPTQLNLIVSILNLLRNHRNSSEQVPYVWNQEGHTLIRQYKHEETSSKYSLFSPLISDTWEIRSELARDHAISESVFGWQNVSIESQLYPDGHSKLFVSFELKLVNQQQSLIYSKLSESTTISQAVHLFGNLIRRNKSMVYLGLPHFQVERKSCQPHFCKSLLEFINEYQDLLSDDKLLATTSVSIAYLRLLDYIRINSGQINRKEVVRILNKYHQSRAKNGNVIKTLLDGIASSLHGEAFLAALDHLNLPKCQGDFVEDCERFLVVLATTGYTVANMGSSFVADHSLSVEQILDVLIPLFNDKPSKWADDRVRQSFALTIATLLHSYQLFTKINFNETNLNHIQYESSRVNLRYHSNPTWFVNVSPEDGNTLEKILKPDFESHFNIKHHQEKLITFSEKILKQLISDLDACKDQECRIIYLNAIGNARIISKYGVLSTLKRYALKSGKRESIASMKAMKDCVQFEALTNNLLSNEKLLIRLRQLLIRILYDSNLETTSRLIAAELLANYIDINGHVTFELIHHLENFPSELALMIWKRAVVNVLNRNDNSIEQSKNWHLQSKILTGESLSFAYLLGSNGYVNASYGVILEVFKGRLPKETSFNVDISRNGMFQDVINIGLFARGLQSVAGDSIDYNENDEENNNISEPESTLAGMTLTVLGNQLRQFLFFSSTSELMGHLWSGVASEPTSALRANILLADYFDIKPLINGLLVEQSYKGIFSLDLNGKVEVSLWNRNSHSNVQTNGAILFQGSQQIYTTDQLTSAKKLFSLGAESKLNFITDFDFYTTPYRICIQITQPEFIFRHNTRKYEQVHSDNLHRRIHRRAYTIPAKSFMLNRKNSETCTLMHGGTNENEFNY